MIKYVVGFAFSKDGSNLVLMEKQKPDWQKGKFNGIGGKIEFGETPLEAMVREFKEETGVSLSPDEFNKYAILNGKGYELHCFRCFTDEIHNCKTIEKEQVYVFSMNTAIACPLVCSCKILIPMAADEEFIYCEIAHSN